ncbi:hypothetical protein VHEMI04608 [[Torrubiella] hemipterigena]|uniref:Peptidase S8/S53 domain-containing protein n=1 Tax=[Torrubiella] hemipterigena TaxID=1531966 RepID=A0A0A1SVS7_9HYPO|nr:hypothetical protein VHEMI04608 [[Torrubiella] hemipterigena]
MRKSVFTDPPHSDVFITSTHTISKCLRLKAIHIFRGDHWPTKSTFKQQSDLALLYLHKETTGRYIVKFKDDATAASDNDILRIAGVATRSIYSEVSQGFSAALTSEALQLNRERTDVEYIEEDGTGNWIAGVEATNSTNDWIDQADATWDIARVANKSPGVSTYSYHKAAGEGMCAYIVDTGIDDKHPEFEGRAKQIKSFVSGTTDDNGHRTHCAGTIGSKTYGLAKKATLFGNKVLDKKGQGTMDGIMSGCDFVLKEEPDRKCKAVLTNFSLGGGKHKAMNDAAAGIVKKGHFMAAAARNSNKDAADFSPTSEPSICTVGATDSSDQKARFSNFGSVVDIQAPCVDAVSTIPGGETYPASGTSMACPHVVGQAAVLISQGLAKSTDACEKMKEMALDAAKGFPSGTTSKLLFNGNPGAK